MKLFTKYNRINIAATILIFLAASVAFYFTLRYVLLEQVDDDLKIEQREITAYVEKYGRLPENIKVKDQIISYMPVSAAYTRREIGTIEQKDSLDMKAEKFRQLQFGIRVGEQWYKVSVQKSLDETNDFIDSVVIISITTILVILLVSFVINRFVIKKLWLPFNRSLEAVKRFRVSKENSLEFSPTDIDEFKLMNEVLEQLTQQAQLDYLSLKTFSENASHEIQTPIAIIQSKLDLLIQDEELTEKQSKTVQVVYDAILRLSRLNNSLLLLAKIENGQYTELKDFDLKKHLEEKINEFRELWQSQHLEIQCELRESLCTINPQLAEILLNNLLSNATKHNFEGGSIFIMLNNRELIVSNTSREQPLNENMIFQRFYKPSQSRENNGLGLSIIRKICDASGLTVRYSFDDNKHSFVIQW